MQQHEDWGLLKVALAWVLTLVGSLTLSTWVLIFTLLYSMFQTYKVVLEIRKLHRENDERKRLP